MTNKQTKMEFTLINIGPHENLSFSSEKDVDYAIYATNGQGKTFISRCFAALQDDNYPYTCHLTSYGKNKSSFNLNVCNEISSFNIDNNNIIRSKKIDRIFYVFNRDYIEDNVEKKEYKPDKTITGVILGKNNIDLSNEKKALRELKESINSLKEELEKEIIKTKDSLAKAGVSKSMNEYKDLTFEKLMDMNGIDSHEYEVVYNRINILANMPEDLSGIPTIEALTDTIDYDNLKKLLEEKVKPSNYEKEFTDYIKENTKFIEHGLKLISEHNSVCPYCMRELDNNSQMLIHHYSEFLEDKEAQITKSLANYIEQFSSLGIKISNIKRQIETCNEKYRIIKTYIESLENPSFKELEKILENSEKLINSIIEDIDRKMKQLSSVSINFDSFIYKDSIQNLNKMIEEVNREIGRINFRKNNMQKIITEQKRKLCIEAFKKLRIETDDKIKIYHILKEDIVMKESEIKSKELTNNIVRKEIISSTFSSLLNEFFNDKYVFDKEKNEIKLRKRFDVKDKRFVLSDGEKSIIAFIYYISNVYSLVENENDYEKIIFIIDDPISSMDFSYVYETANVIRNLNNILNVKYNKKVVLTHNFEFFNILKRNKVCKGYYVLNNGSIEKMGKEMLLPYECHLEDIYNISKGKIKPNHTTPNSIRHILETICSFENGKKSSEVLFHFLQNNNEFKNSNYIYTLMHDLSHGAYREEKPYLEDEIVKACRDVIDFIDNKYPGQLSELKQP